jgi:hypothetical protein
MIRVLQILTSWLTGDVSKALAKAYADKNNADTEQMRVQADATIRALEIQQESRAQGGLLTSWVQTLWAIPFVVYTWKLVMWDKVLGLGSTDALSVSLLQEQALIIGFYFGGSAAIKVARVLRK